MKKAKLFMMLALLVMGVSNVFAQNVTIRANNGSTIAAVKNGGTTDTFFNLGGFATWQHEQLSMVLTVSDGTDLTPNGQLDNPANNLFANGEHMQIAKGKASGANVCYVTLSLPLGYRFTGYNISFTKPRNAQNSEFNTGSNGSDSSTFGETGSNFSTYTTQASITIGGAAQTISRTETETTHMGNVLYFKLQNPTSSRALIELQSAEIFFTAEENYSPVTPAGDVTNQSAVDIPFATSKVDFGTIKSRSYNGTTRVSYSSANVSDLEANFYLYEAESVEDGTGFDGISGNVVKYQSGTISSDGGYFKLGRENQEQIYYLETPNYVEVSDGTKVPVGYRIVGAEFEYANKITASRTFRISYTTGGRTYYLGTNGRFSTTQTTWEMDSEGYISSNGYYLYFNNGYAATQRSKPDESERFGIDANNNIYQLNWPTYFITCYSETSGWGWNQQTTRYGLISNTSGQKATYDEISTTTSTLGDFTINVYSKDGENVYESKSDGNGTISLSGLNNDAVKFGVQGIGLVRATLTLQALDPYLDHMEVVCNDLDQPAIRISQDFTASDFSVSGGEFYFYVPVDTKNVGISFENLSSKYFDETYTGGSATHTSRINFVQSLHNQAFGTTVNNIYDNTSEAADAQLERLKVDVVGSAKFKFNNADEVGTSGGTYTEYPFTFARYAEEGGSFGKMEYAVTEEDQVSTKYVFTTDETRYNIAPTTAIQHRAYAYYQMIVHVQSHNYEPKIKFTKVYDKTFYTDDEGAIKYDAFYGVEVTAPYTENGVEKQGYASTKDIFEGIERILGTDKVDDFGNTDLPESSKQIIYLDFSKLAGIYQITTDENPDMESYSNSNAKNCLIFLPSGSAAPNDNVAYQLGSGDFQAVNNIVITDKQPFYSPYKIQVPSANVAEYKRQITSDQNGKVINATVVLPFTIAVEDGVHTNDDNSCTFTISTMNTGTTNVLAHEEGSSIDFGIGYFKAISGTATESNKPYVLTIEKSSWTDANSSFLVRSHGAVIEPTPAGGVFTNESASGTFDGDTYNFTHKGTYVGKEIENAATASEKVFYFAHDYFLDSKTLKKGLSLKILPFRSFYQYSGGAGAKMTQFRIVFGENEDLSGTNGINEIQRDADLAVIPGKGVITLMARAEKDITIHAANGQTVDKCNLKAGETRTVAVPAGVYVINGVKMVVK